MAGETRMSLIKVKGRGAENLGRRNKIMNGDAKVAQRATTAAEVSAFVLDRWKIDAAAQDQLACQVTQSSDTPDGEGFSYSHLININTAETAIDTNEYLRYYQTVEAQNLQDAAYGSSSPKKMQLSFWVKATGTNVTGTYGILFWIQDANKYQNATYTINAANTWEKKTIEIGTTGHGTINNDNGIGMRVNFFLMAGSQYTSGGGYINQWGTAAGAAANSHYAVGHATNSFVQTQNNKWYITGIQLEVSDNATDFEHRSVGEELDLCHRYFFKPITQQNYAPFPIVFNRTVSTGSNGYFAFTIPLPKPMRTLPTFTHNLSNSNHAGSGAGAAAGNWQFYWQNQGWGSYAGSGNMNTINRAMSGDSCVHLGNYYITPSAVQFDQLAIGKDLTLEFSAEL
tara:strand:- start:275 stop:1468 length:1194 start_codon:yes stop_codon:yes gene_type:complete